jgi:VIT1/CCC1 family predicted Fe2+/Mn2+ transporter
MAGAASLLAFSVGALVPLLPYLVGLPHLAATLAITAAALIAGGMVVGRITGRRSWARGCGRSRWVAWPSRSRSLWGT